MLLSSEYNHIVWECREKLGKWECWEVQCLTTCDTLPKAYFLRYYKSPDSLTIDTMLHPSHYRHDANPQVIHGVAERFSTLFWDVISLSAQKKQSAYFHLRDEKWIDTISMNEFSLLASFSRQNPDIYRVGFSEEGGIISVEDIMSVVRKLVPTDTIRYPRNVTNLPEWVYKKVEDMTSTLQRILSGN